MFRPDHKKYFIYNKLFDCSIGRDSELKTINLQNCQIPKQTTKCQTVFGKIVLFICLILQKFLSAFIKKYVHKFVSDENMVSCAVANCKNTSAKISKNKDGITFHRFVF